METQPLPQQTSEPLPLPPGRRITFNDDDEDYVEYLLRDERNATLATLGVGRFRGCCGAREFFDLRAYQESNHKPLATLQELADLMNHALEKVEESIAFAVYTTIATQKDVIKVLKATGFACVAGPTLNPNSGRKVTMWVKSLH